MRIVKKIAVSADYGLDNFNKNQTYINNPNVNWDCYCACQGMNQVIELTTSSSNCLIR